MCRLDGLKFGYVFVLFAGIAIGVVLKSELAILLLHIVYTRSSREIEVGICKSWLAWASVKVQVARFDVQ